jgi:hypothetical protein
LKEINLEILTNGKRHIGKQKQKATITLLSSPFSLQQNENKRRQHQQSCYRFLCYNINKAIIAFFAATKGKEGGNGSFVVVAFFTAA